MPETGLGKYPYAFLINHKPYFERIGDFAFITVEEPAGPRTICIPMRFFDPYLDEALQGVEEWRDERDNKIVGFPLTSENRTT